MNKFDIEAEQAVLGSIIYRNELILEVSAILKPNHFSQERHRRIFESMMELEDSSAPIDEITLGDMLKKKGNLWQDGLIYLAELIDHTPSSGNVLYYSKIVKDHFEEREGEAIANELLKNIHTKGYKEAYAIASERFEELGVDENEVQTLNQMSAEFFLSLEELAEKEGSIPGLVTGFLVIDKLLNGLEPGSVTVIGARPSVGKSAWAMNIFDNLCRKYIGLFVSLEMNKRQNQIRYYSGALKIKNTSLMNADMQAEEWDKLAFGMENLTSDGVLDRANFLIGTSVTIESIKATVKKMVKKGLKFLIIDYLQLLESNKKTQIREQEVAYISRQIKKIALENHIPVIILSQLNRKADGKEPTLSELRESGAIEQDADNVIFIHNYEENDQEVFKLIVAKGRMGSKGAEIVNFDKRYTRFRDNERD